MGDITAAELREAADSANELNELLDKVNQDRRLDTFLMGYDLDHLAGQFEGLANKLDPEGARE